MNRARRRALGRLPMSLNPWEVALVEVPVTIEGVETEGLLVIAERGSGLVRAAGPVLQGESLWPVLGPAFTDPHAPCAPARPARLCCSDPALIRRLARELRGLGIGIEQVATTPAVDEVIASMRSHFAPVTAPGITVDLDLWASALETLARIAPWRAVSDGVLFRFEGVPMLEDVIALVLGQAGEQRGVALHPTQDQYERFRDAALEGDISALEGVEALSVYLDPIAELDPEEVAACREAGLVTTGGLCPRLLVLAGGVASPATDAAQRVLLAVVQGIATLTARDADDLELASARCVASTCLGTVEVRSTPPERDEHEDEPDLVEAEHAVGVGPIRNIEDGSERTALVVKLRKRDAERLAVQLADVDGLRIEVEGAGHVVRALVGGVDLGPLVRLWQGHHVQRLAAADGVVLCVSAGGPKRRRIHPKDFVMMRNVVVEASESPPVGHDPVFDQPIARWPEASETLLRFADPVLHGRSALSATEIGTALDMAAAVWNAVVMADFAGESRYLDDLRHAVGKRPGPRFVAEMLIERKRSGFAADPRLLGPVRVDAERGVPRVFVETRLPPGYRVGVDER